MKTWLSSLFATMQKSASYSYSERSIEWEEDNSNESNGTAATWEQKNIIMNEKNEIVEIRQRSLSIDEFHYYSPTNPGF